jgi:uncharacterized protein (UPF0332 family)
MRKTFKKLLDEGLIRRLEKPHPKQARGRLKAARRSLVASATLTPTDSDWAYSIAYDAALQAGRGLMFQMGYRPTSGEGAHVAVVRFLDEALRETIPQEVEMMETMRRKRNRAVYDSVGIVSKGELEAAQNVARTIVDTIGDIIEGTLRLELDT